MLPRGGARGTADSHVAGERTSASTKTTGNPSDVCLNPSFNPIDAENRIEYLETEIEKAVKSQTSKRNQLLRTFISIAAVFLILPYAILTAIIGRVSPDLLLLGSVLLVSSFAITLALFVTVGSNAIIQSQDQEIVLLNQSIHLHVELTEYNTTQWLKQRGKYWP
jgi:hypothetical protein